jgi:hypothetical protein
MTDDGTSDVVASCSSHARAHSTSMSPSSLVHWGSDMYCVTCTLGGCLLLEEKSYTVSTTADMRYHAHFQYEPDMDTDAPYMRHSVSSKPP